MPKRSLTSAAVERIKPPEFGQADHFDIGYPGLAHARMRLAIWPISVGLKYRIGTGSPLKMTRDD